MTPLGFARRMRVLRAEMALAGLDQLVVTSLANVRWLTGFSGSNALMVIGVDGFVIGTDGRYEEHAGNCLDTMSGQGETSGLLQIVRAGVEQALADTLPAEGTVGFEGSVVTYDAHERLRAVYGQDRLVRAPLLIETARQDKEQGEVERIEAAADIADAAFARLLAQLTPGQTERELAARLNFEMLNGGADGLSFDTIVASGPNGALPHAQPSSRVVSEGDLVVFDFGASIDGYGSDMTRTVVAGNEPNERQRLLYEAVAESQEAGFQAIHAGVAAAEVDKVCRDLISDRGFGTNFVHGTGHSLGLEIHEQPFLSATATETLRAGMVVTVEPGIYLPGECGIRIEDTVLVTSDGARRLTKASKGL